MKKNTKFIIALTLVVVMMLSSMATFASQDLFVMKTKSLLEKETTAEMIVPPTPEFTEINIETSFNKNSDHQMDSNSYQTRNWLTNNVTSVIRAYKDGRVQLRIWNSGDPVDKYKGHITINGSEYPIDKRHLRYGSTIIEWNKPMTKIEDKIKLDVMLQDGSVIAYAKLSHTRYNFVGGKYGSMQALGGQRHHTPCVAAISGHITTYSGPAIRMLTSDHKKTGSHPNQLFSDRYRNLQAKYIDEGNFMKAVEMDIKDIQKKFPDGRYNDALNEMYQYARTLD